MSTTSTAATTVARTGRPLPLAARVGLVIAALLGLADAVSNGAMLADGGIAIAGLALGVVTLVAVPFAWRAARPARITVAVSRVLSGLTGLPAFFVDGVPANWVVLAAAGLVLNVVVAVLVLRPAQR
jgi:hypothetical protein